MWPGSYFVTYRISVADYFPSFHVFFKKIFYQHTFSLLLVSNLISQAKPLDERVRICLKIESGNKNYIIFLTYSKCQLHRLALKKYLKIPQFRQISIFRSKIEIIRLNQSEIKIEEIFKLLNIKTKMS